MSIHSARREPCRRKFFPAALSDYPTVIIVSMIKTCVLCRFVRTVHICAVCAVCAEKKKAAGETSHRSAFDRIGIATPVPYGFATQSASVMLSSSEMNRVGWLNVYRLAETERTTPWPDSIFSNVKYPKVLVMA